MKRIMTVLAVAGLCTAAPKHAVAQGSTIGVAAGLTMPMSDYGDADKMGFNVGANWTFALGTSPVKLRVEGNYSTTSHDGFDGKFNILGGMASVVYPFQTAGQIRPYVLGGIGYYNVKETISDESGSGVGFGGGLGLNFKMSSTTLFAEARYLTSKAQDANFDRLPIVVGVNFPIGGSHK